MSDDGRAKRLKSSEDGVVLAQRERIAELESENAQLRSGTLAGNQVVAEQRGRIADLESEIAQLRRRVLQQEGNHELLPVFVATTVTVDLSRIDSSIVAQISSFLGTSRELLNLGLTCKPFGWRQPTLSLAEEVARQIVCSRATDAEKSCLPQCVSGTTTWLSILHRFEHLLVFDVLLGERIEHRNGNKATVYGSGHLLVCTALSSIYTMRTGSHYAEFEITGTPIIGIVRPMPSLDAGATANEECYYLIGERELYPDFLAQRSDEWGFGNVQACEYFCGTGEMSWSDWDEEDEEEEERALIGWEGIESCGTGDTIGMLLNLVEGTLTVYKNNRRLGVMKDGLSGSYCWYGSVSRGSAVAIKRGELPMS